MQVHKFVLTGCFSIALAACGGAVPLAVQSASVDGAGVAVRMRWQPDPVVLDALDHGIALQFKIDLAAQGAARLFWHPDLAQRETRIELRYFPLSRQYQWRDLDRGDTRNYSGRASLIAALEDLHLPVPDGFRGADVRRYRIRIELEREALPGALRLPALLDPKWRMSGDYAWPAPNAG